MSTQTKTVNAGPVGMKPKGAYNASTTYTLLDCVFYNHDSWVCTAIQQDGTAGTVTGVTPTDGSQYWQALTDGGRAAYNVGTQVRSDFDSWFGATANAGIRKTVSDWFAQVQAEWTAWFSDTLATGVRKIWNTWFSARQSDWSSLSQDVTTATDAAISKAADAEYQAGQAELAARKATNVNAYMVDYDLKVTDRDGHTSSTNVKGDKGEGINYATMTDAQKNELAQKVIQQICTQNVIGPRYDADHRCVNYDLSNGVKYDEDARCIKLG